MKSVARSKRNKESGRNKLNASQYTRDLVRVTELDDYDNSSSGRDSYYDASSSRYDRKPRNRDYSGSDSDYDSKRSSSTKFRKPPRKDSFGRSSRSPSQKSDSWFSESDQSSDRGKRKPKQVAASAYKKSQVTQVVKKD